MVTPRHEMAGHGFVERDEGGRKYRGFGGYQSGYQSRFAVRAMAVANLAANLGVPGLFRAAGEREALRKLPSPD